MPLLFLFLFLSPSAPLFIDNAFGFWPGRGIADSIMLDLCYNQAIAAVLS